MAARTVNTVHVAMLVTGAVGFLALGWVDTIRITIRRLTGSYDTGGIQTPSSGRSAPFPSPGAGGGGGGGGGGSW